MKKSILFSLSVFITLFLSIKVFAQEVSLSELQTICLMSKWEDVNQYLLKMGWEYHDSEKGESNQYNTITWSFKKITFNKIEDGWFHLYTYDGLPNKIIYLVPNTRGYTTITNTLKSYGYKLVKKSIEDSEIVLTYSNNKFTLEITTKKMKGDFNVSNTVYIFKLIKKSGIYDLDNARKKEYWNNGDRIKTEYTLKNGLKNGEFIEYHYNGQIKQKGNYISGKENGLFITYDEFGTKMFEYQMKNGENNGEFRIYFGNGKIMLKGNYINGKQEGLLTAYNEDGIITSEGYMKNGEMNGKLKTYYQTGQIKQISNYINGKEEGLIVEYSEDGIIESEYFMKNGEKNGEFKVYYENGQLMIKGNYINGKKDGLFVEYSEDGILEGEGYFKNDENHGELKIYHENGKLKLKGNLINGKNEGLFVEYSEDGTVMSEIYFKNGERNGEFKVYYENGQLMNKGNFINGKKEGPYVEYFYDQYGNLIFEYSGIFKDELKEGVWNWYIFRNSEKELYEFNTYKNDIEEGSFKSVEGDSVIYGTLLNGQLHGKYHIFINLLGSIFGEYTSLDSANLTILTRGNYSFGKKSGNWVYYNYMTKIREGGFGNDLKEGVWKYYYPNYFDLQTNDVVDYGGELYLIETYKKGKRNGLSEKFSFLEPIKSLCDTSIYPVKSPLDSCTEYVYNKLYLKEFYKNGELHGSFVLKDSLGTLIRKGNFNQGKKDGEWQFFESDDFAYRILNYSNGRLNGKIVNYQRKGCFKDIWYFNNDKLEELVVYDSTGHTLDIKYELLNESDYGFNIRMSDYNKGILSYSNEYFVAKDGESQFSPYDLNFNSHLFTFYFIITIQSTNQYGAKLGYSYGRYTFYDENGNEKVTGNFADEDKIGVWKYNYPEQGVQLQIDYVNDDLRIEKYFILNTETVFNGIFLYEDLDNKILEKRKIKNGLRNGATIYLDLNGKQLSKEKYIDGLKI